mgnify:CR=1 FL=1
MENQIIRLNRQYVIGKNYDDDEQLAYVYLENGQEYPLNDFVENYWHIRMEASGTCGIYFELDLERSTYSSVDDSEKELSRLESYLIDWIADEYQTTPDKILIQ